MHKSQSAKQSIKSITAITKAVIKLATAVKSMKRSILLFSASLWSVGPSEGLEVNSRNRELQHRRPVLQWMSGQEKDMADR